MVFQSLGFLISLSLHPGFLSFSVVIAFDSPSVAVSNIIGYVCMS